MSASRVQAKPTVVRIRCRSCGAERVLDMTREAQLPHQCPGAADRTLATPCPLDPYDVVAGECRCVDQQILKLQESPQSIPTGELPRTMVLAVDRHLVGVAQPGSRVAVTGIYTVMDARGGGGGGGGGRRERAGSATIRVPYVRAVGVADETAGAGRSARTFTPAEESDFIALARRPNLYELLCASVAPAIYGHADVKRALLCQLFGGSVKFLPDGVKLRGDINVLLLGDPGTAKSQLLKFVEKVAPIGVYTSGKGSSAAGLTASVIRDGQTREFYLEGGAMVLADGGVVCIDEFDKMNPNDRVAIHEAMEQQTISIAKAGITTILNSRTAVLAAANPVFGRYDEGRDAADNIDFQTTILSRFDMIFLIRDRRDVEHDKTVASHVMRIHFADRGRVPVSASAMPSAAASGSSSGVLDVARLKRYIAYCRAKSAPAITETAARKLEDFFVLVRDSTRQRPTTGGGGARGTSFSNKIPITVRQLEAIVRITEALAKMTLQPTATEQHVEEAIRLFTASTVDALNTGAVTSSEQLTPEMQDQVQVAEALLRRTVPVGASALERHILAGFTKQGVSTVATRIALDAMVRRGEVEYRRQRRYVYRKR